VLERLGSHDPVTLARRDVARAFNRSGDSRVSTHLHHLVRGGWLRVAKRSTGNYAHTYTRGPRLVADKNLRRTWDELSQALYGPDGLLARFRGSPAFAHGLLLESGLLCLGALLQATGPASNVQLARYLSALVPRSTVTGAVDRLVRFALVESTDAGFVVVPDWESTLETLIEAENAGAARVRRNVDRWTRERDSFDERLDRGDITDQGRVSLRKLPCVCCGGSGGQLEHFPPRRFLNSYNPHLLWSICGDCNNSMNGFIRSLHDVEPPVVDGFWCTPGVDPGDLLQASTEFGIRRFYRAFDQRSGHRGRSSGVRRRSTRRRERRTRTTTPEVAKALAARAIRFPWALYRYLQEHDLLTSERVPSTKRPPSRRRKNDSTGSLDNSRLPY
jgi:predicted transcriptional regulator